MLAVVVGALAACASPQDKAAKGQEKAADWQDKAAKADPEPREERMKRLDEYKACVEEAGDDRAELEACDRTLKAVDALK